MKQVHLLFGVPCSGKTWVCNQLQSHGWTYIQHDTNTYPGILKLIQLATTDNIIVDCPFNERALRAAIENSGFKVLPLAVTDSPDTINYRYVQRKGVPAPKQILTRAVTIHNKVREWNCQVGTSSEILTLLIGV